MAAIKIAVNLLRCKATEPGGGDQWRAAETTPGANRKVTAGVTRRWPGDWPLGTFGGAGPVGGVDQTMDRPALPRGVPQQFSVCTGRFPVKV